jgi:hypothetical protein
MEVPKSKASQLDKMLFAAFYLNEAKQMSPI